MENERVILQVELENGVEMHVEATPIGEQQVALGKLPFRNFKKSIETIAKEVSESIQTVQPNKASIKFGLEIGVQSDGLTALLAQGSSKTNLEITLEWEN